jgi:hypothetical protein
MMKQTTILLLLTVIAITARPQAVQKKPVQKAVRVKVFRDTVYDFAVDSLHHNMGRVNIHYRRLTKTFKYLGETPGLIREAWTGDPYFICEYPREPLMPGREYQFTVCFAFGGGGGRFQKQMGFVLQDEKIIAFTFTGEVMPEGQFK